MKIPTKVSYICCFNLHIFLLLYRMIIPSSVFFCFIFYGCVFNLTLTFKEFKLDSMNLSSALNYAYNESKKERKTVRETEAWLEYIWVLYGCCCLFCQRHCVCLLFDFVFVSYITTCQRSMLKPGKSRIN